MRRKSRYGATWRRRDVADISAEIDASWCRREDQRAADEGAAGTGIGACSKVWRTLRRCEYTADSDLENRLRAPPGVGRPPGSEHANGEPCAAVFRHRSGRSLCGWQTAPRILGGRHSGGGVRDG